MLKHIEFTEPADDGKERQRLVRLEGLADAKEFGQGRLLVAIEGPGGTHFAYEMRGTIAGLVYALRSACAEGYGLVPRS